MIMRVQQAALSNYGSILAFYDDVIDRTPEIGRHAWWQKGKHPTAEGVRAYIEEGSMYLCRDDRAIIAVMSHPVPGRGLSSRQVAQGFGG